MFEGWSNFFIATGAAGGTLVGLLFVVVTLGSGLPTARKLKIAHASLTPALYSFASVLLESMVVLVPWKCNLPSGVIFILIGIGGLIYRIQAVRVRRTLHLTAIQSKLDRIIHNLTPILASVVLIYGDAALIAGESGAPFAIASSTRVAYSLSHPPLPPG